MQITVHEEANRVELHVAGRVDATWAEHLSAAIENIVRAGGHRIVLNFSEVEYISSLGIRVLLVHYKLLKSVDGSLAIIHPSQFSSDILSVAGLYEMLVDNNAALDTTVAATKPKQRRGAADYVIYPQPVTRELSCRLVGDPALLSTTGFATDDCRTLAFPSGTYAVGLGAFGHGYADCLDRFGEFLAAAGCAITLPTNEPQALPDYVIEQGHLVPQVETLFALVGEGDFSTMVRFDAAPDGGGKVALSELVDSLIDISGANAIGFVVLAEAAGVVGATLLKSPAGRPLARELPAVREWLSFTTERSSEKSLSLLVGVASRAVDEGSEAFLRPIKSGSATAAHIHAAVFPYRPVQRGALPFGKTVADLLAASSPSAVLHLMADTRRFEGVGETDLVRGACWFGPLSSIARTNHP